MTGTGNRADGRRTALVTGASSGIGAVFADRLAGEGYDLVLVARRGDRLDQLAEGLRASAGAAVEVIAADLTSPADLDRVAARVAGDPPDMLVNNAGYAVYQPYAEADPAEVDGMIALNITALTRLTRAALPGMVSRGSGVVINVASGLAFAVSATRATYSATKAFVVHFSRILHEEVRGTGVRVQALCPGLTATEFHNRSGTDMSRIPAALVMSAEDVVDASLAGLRLGEVVCIPGLEDSHLLERFEEAQAELAQGFVRTSAAATRYKTGPAGS